MATTWKCDNCGREAGPEEVATTFLSVGWRTGRARDACSIECAHTILDMIRDDPAELIDAGVEWGGR